MRVNEYDPSDTIAQGLADFAAATNVRAAAEDGAAMYRTMSREITQAMRPGDVCRLALVAMIIRPHVRVECFIAVLTDRIVVTWKRGVFRMTTYQVVVAIDTITDVHRHPGSGPTRGAALLTIAGTPSVTVALATDSAAVAAETIRTALL